MPRKKLESICSNAILNKPGHESTASCSFDIGITKGKFSTYSCFAISDCDRTIRLSFSISSKDRYENAIYKINTLIQEAEKFRDGLITAKSHNDEVTRQKRKKRAAKKLEKEDQK